jgi:hypothetical protein
MVRTSEILISEVIHELKIRFFNLFGFVSLIAIVQKIKILSNRRQTKVKKMAVKENVNR